MRREGSGLSAMLVGRTQGNKGTVEVLVNWGQVAIRNQGERFANTLDSISLSQHGVSIGKLTRVLNAGLKRFDTTSREQMVDRLVGTF